MLDLLQLKNNSFEREILWVVKTSVQICGFLWRSRMKASSVCTNKIGYFLNLSL